MDECEYLDQFLHSPSFSDTDLRQRMSGLCYNEQENNNSIATSLINLSPQDASSAVLSSDSEYGRNMFFHRDQSFHGNACNGMVNGSLEPKKLDFSYNVAAPLSGNISSSSLCDQEMGISQHNYLEPPGFGAFQEDLQTLSQTRPLSHHLQSYEGVSFFGLQEDQYLDEDLYSIENHPRNYPASVSSRGTLDSQNYSIPSLASNGFQSTSQTVMSRPAGEFNGARRPRTRARRGQATDPHSIAERLRREKISGRMRNLQELLPNPNKTDKASMLDEIIEYVKYLQLQIKVLSMSRLGATDAVVPLITDYQSESEMVFPSEEAAFEQELVKLMDSNVTKAMQFLQSKGLCLMPVALASAMSPRDEKGNRVGPVSSNSDPVMRNPTVAGGNNVMVKPEDENDSLE